MDAKFELTQKEVEWAVIEWMRKHRGVFLEGKDLKWHYSINSDGNDFREMSPRFRIHVRKDNFSAQSPDAGHP